MTLTRLLRDVIQRSTTAQLRVLISDGITRAVRTYAYGVLVNRQRHLKGGAR